jgi:hypothetical protein
MEDNAQLGTYSELEYRLKPLLYLIRDEWRQRISLLTSSILELGDGGRRTTYILSVDFR